MPEGSLTVKVGQAKSLLVASTAGLFPWHESSLRVLLKLQL